MATATQLFTSRDAAGAAYASALDALKVAWIELRAFDLACSNQRVLAAHPDGANRVPVATFGNPSEWGGRPLQHPVYAPLPEVVLWDQAAHAQALTHINGLN